MDLAILIPNSLKGLVQGAADHLECLGAPEGVAIPEADSWDWDTIRSVGLAADLSGFDALVCMASDPVTPFADEARARFTEPTVCRRRTAVLTATALAAVTERIQIFVPSLAEDPCNEDVAAHLNSIAPGRIRLHCEATAGVAQHNVVGSDDGRSDTVGRSAVLNGDQRQLSLSLIDDSTGHIGAHVSADHGRAEGTEGDERNGVYLLYSIIGAETGSEARARADMGTGTALVPELVGSFAQIAATLDALSIDTGVDGVVLVWRDPVAGLIDFDAHIRPLLASPGVRT